jgi:hypothetical protein
VIFVTSIYNNNPFSSFNIKTNIPYQTALATINLQANNTSTSDSNDTSSFTSTNNQTPVDNAGTDKTTNQNTTVIPNIPSFVKVVVPVNNTGGGTAQPSDFSIRMYADNNPKPYDFDGSEQGTIVSMTGKGNYSVSISQKDTLKPTYGVSFSGDCALDSSGSGRGSASIDEGGRQTCIATMVFPNFN